MIITKAVAQEPRPVERIIIKDSAGWIVSIRPDGGASVSNMNDLDAGVSLPKGSFSFSKLLAGITPKDADFEHSTSSYSVATKTGDEVDFRTLKEKYIGDEVFTKSVELLKSVQGRYAQDILPILSKLHPSKASGVLASQPAATLN